MLSLLSSIHLIILAFNVFVFSLNVTHYSPLAHRTMAYCSPRKTSALVVPHRRTHASLQWPQSIGLCSVTDKVTPRWFLNSNASALS
jgi:hypothetical protein